MRSTKCHNLMYSKIYIKIYISVSGLVCGTCQVNMYAVFVTKNVVTYDYLKCVKIIFIKCEANMPINALFSVSPANEIAYCDHCHDDHDHNTAAINIFTCETTSED